MSSQTEHDFQGHGRNAVVFGAGRIGRGFLGQLLCEAGFLTIFVDTDITLVNALNHRREYPLHLVSEAGVQEITVSHVSPASGRHGGTQCSPSTCRSFRHRCRRCQSAADRPSVGFGLPSASGCHGSAFGYTPLREPMARRNSDAQSFASTLARRCSL
jgi:hypothetical protein